MRKIDVSLVRDALCESAGKAATVYGEDILSSLKKNREKESGMSRDAMDMLLKNAQIAAEENIPICQDTGMAIVYVHLGQNVQLTGGSLYEAIQEGIREGYRRHYLRASVVSDPLFERKNTKDNTPAVIYTDLTDSDTLEIEWTAKGFGSENMSAIKMLKPAEGIEGVKKFVLDTIANAGPNACPPMIVGVGIGGTFDYSAVLAKKALLRSLNDHNPDERYARLEEELLEAANALKIGPMGLHGKTTALKIQIESFPTHIAGMPCAVNICCHACRHERLVF